MEPKIIYQVKGINGFPREITSLFANVINLAHYHLQLEALVEPLDDGVALYYEKMKDFYRLHKFIREVAGASKGALPMGTVESADPFELKVLFEKIPPHLNPGRLVSHFMSAFEFPENRIFVQKIGRGEYHIKFENAKNSRRILARLNESIPEAIQLKI